MPEGTSSLLGHALGYAHAGWSVLPIKTAGKTPLTTKGVKDATDDPNTIREWWDRWPGANIGLAVPTGFVVVDIDSPHALNQIKSEGLDLPKTVCAKTFRGWHLWYSTSRNEVGNRVGLRPGVDLRGRNGYLVVPPSVHPSGHIYRWQVALAREVIAAAPDWLTDGSVDGALGTRLAESPSTDWTRKISEPVQLGRRNQTLAEVAGLLFRAHPAEIAAELAWCWAQVKLSPPLPHHEVMRTLDSIARLELRRWSPNP